MSIGSPDLRARQAQLAHDLIVEAALDLLISCPHDELSVRAVAHRAGMSERTVFRYFASRDALLDVVAAEMVRRQAVPPPPERLQELPDYPAQAFARFEEIAGLIKASLRGDVYERIRSGDLVNRGAAIANMVDAAAPLVDAATRRLVAKNILYFVVASTWNYYRTRFAMSAEETVAAARRAIVDALAGLERENR